MRTKRPTSAAAEEILGGYFPVLDHGFVALVDYMGDDASVERAARVSYGHGTRRVSRTRGLLRYLRRHLHTTPSEMVELNFHCAMPIFVARQWVRHRTASVNEYSGRYSLMPLLFYSPRREHFALQSESGNQGRAVEAAGAELHAEAVRRWEGARARVAADYGWLAGENVARELARIDLPLSTYTQWYWKIDLHNLLHFLTLRVDPHAQWEIREYGRVIAGMVKRVAPLSYEAWMDYQVMGGQAVARRDAGALQAGGGRRGGSGRPRGRETVRLGLGGPGTVRARDSRIQDQARSSRGARLRARPVANAAARGGGGGRARGGARCGTTMIYNM